MMFKDRRDAARQLAKKLDKFKDDPKTVVIALPRGGVVLGKIIADELGKPIDLVIPRKVGAPENPEYAICAVAEGESEYCNEAEAARVDRKWLEEEKRKERKEAQRRREVYLSGRKKIELAGKTVLIVDDGIATGITMRVAIEEVRKQNPQSIVVAVPVSSREAISEIEKFVDEVVVLDAPLFFGAIGAFYENFAQVEDDEVIKLLSE